MAKSSGSRIAAARSSSTWMKVATSGSSPTRLFTIRLSFLSTAVLVGLGLELSLVVLRRDAVGDLPASGRALELHHHPRVLREWQHRRQGEVDPLGLQLDAGVADEPALEGQLRDAIGCEAPG